MDDGTDTPTDDGLQEQTPDAGAQPEAQPEPTGAPETQGTPPPAEGESLLAGKYKSVEELEKGYQQLATKLGQSRDTSQDEPQEPEPFDPNEFFPEDIDEEPAPEDAAPPAQPAPTVQDPYAQELDALLREDYAGAAALRNASVADMVRQQVGAMLGARDRIDADRRQAQSVYGADLVDKHEDAALELMRRSGGTMPFSAAFRIASEADRLKTAEQRGYDRAVSLLEQRGAGALLSGRPAPVPQPMTPQQEVDAILDDTPGPDDGDYKKL